MASKGKKGGTPPRRSSRARRPEAASAAIVAALAAEAAHAEEAELQKTVGTDQSAPRGAAELKSAVLEDGAIAASADQPLTPEQLAELLDPARLAELGFDPEQFAALMNADAEEALRQLAAAARKFQAKNFHQASSKKVAAESSAAPAADAADGAADGSEGAGGGLGISTLGLVGGIVGAGAIGYVALDGGGDAKGGRAPATTDDSVTTLEDAPVVLTAADFGTFISDEGAAPAVVKITALPTAGALQYNNGTTWVAVTAGQDISAADLAAGKLRFVPAANANGSGYASVSFQVGDGKQFSVTPNKLTINVTAVNDAPVNTVPASAAASEATSVKLAGLSIADVDGGSITTTLAVTNGTLTAGVVNGGAAIAGNGTGTITLTGTAAQINATLTDLSFRGANGFLGTATLTVTTNDGGNGGGTALSDTDSFAITVARAQSGIVSDGYISGGTVFIDVNKNGKLDPGEPTTTTDATGKFSFTTTATGPVVVTGGINTDTGLANTVTLTAPDGAAAVTPLTTLVQALVASGKSVTEANTAVTKALGLPAGTNLATYDIIAAAGSGDANALAAQKAATSIVAVLNAAKATATGDAAAAVETAVASSLAKALDTAAAANAPINLGNPAVLQSVFQDSGQVPANAVAQVAAQAAAVTTLIQSATSLGGIANAQVSAATNKGPVAAADSVVLNEDASITFDVRGNDSDVDGDALRVVLVDGKAISLTSPVAVTGGVVSLGADGKLTFTAASNYNGTPAFTYTVSDGRGGLATGAVNVTVNPVNDAPAAAADTAQTTQNSAVEINVRANDSDVDGDAISITQVNGQAISVGGASVSVTGGFVTLLANGNLKFTPISNYYGPVQFTYTASDGAASSTGNATVSVKPGETLFVAASGLGDVIANAAALAADGVKHIDVNGLAPASVNISDVDAASLVSAGLDFVAQDDIALTIGGSAEGTHLSTSLKALQSLGVDTIVAGAATSLTVDAGAGGIAALAGGALPQFVGADGSLDVTLNTAGGDFSALDLGALADAGIDHLDIGGAGVAGSATISNAQAGELITAGLDFAAEDSITAAAGTQMSTSLKGLQTLGVDVVAAAAGVSAVSVEVGAGGLAGLSGALPDFADSLDVTLAIGDGDLAGSTLANLADDLGAAGIDTLDLADNNGTISNAQAHALVTAGLSFAENDSVTLTTAGTYLSTSLKALQGLGVDQVTGALGVTHVEVNVGEGGLAALADGGDLPVFSDGLDVTLVVDPTANNDVADPTALLAAVSNANIDTLDFGGSLVTDHVGLDEEEAQALIDAGLSIADNDYVTVSAAGTHLSTSLHTLKSLGVDAIAFSAAGVALSNIAVDPALAGAPDGDFDVIVGVDAAAFDGADLSQTADDLAAAGIDYLEVTDLAGVSLTEAQAGHIVDAGLQFTGESHVSMVAAGTHLSTSLHDLQVLGVDTVQATGDAAQQKKVTLDLGDVVVPAAGSLPDFDDTLDVTVEVANASPIAATDLDALLGVDLLSDFTTPELYGDLVAALTDAGIDHIDVDVAGRLDVTDTLASALIDAGLLSVTPQSHVVLDAQEAGDHLSTSLTSMADLGIDQVILKDQGAANPVYVELGDVSTDDLSQLIDSLDTNPLFTGNAEVSLVLSQTMADALAGIDGALAKLDAIGFTELAVLEGTTPLVHGTDLENGPLEVKLIGQQDPLYKLLHG